MNATRIAAGLAVAAVVALAGCATTAGNGRLAGLDADTAATLLVPGRTTEAEARAAFGEGAAIRFASGWQTWHYDYRPGLAKAWDEVPYIGLVTERLGGATTELVLLFDDAGVLRRWSLEDIGRAVGAR